MKTILGLASAAWTQHAGTSAARIAMILATGHNFTKKCRNGCLLAPRLGEKDSPAVYRVIPRAAMNRPRRPRGRRCQCRRSAKIVVLEGVACRRDSRSHVRKRPDRGHASVYTSGMTFDD